MIYTKYWWIYFLGLIQMFWLKEWKITTDLGLNSTFIFEGIDRRGHPRKPMYINIYILQAISFPKQSKFYTKSCSFDTTLDNFQMKTCDIHHANTNIFTKNCLQRLHSFPGHTYILNYLHCNVNVTVIVCPREVCATSGAT